MSTFKIKKGTAFPQVDGHLLQPVRLDGVRVLPGDTAMALGLLCDAFIEAAIDIASASPIGTSTSASTTAPLSYSGPPPSRSAPHSKQAPKAFLPACSALSAPAMAPFRSPVTDALPRELHLKVKDLQGNGTWFHIQKRTPLRKLMAAYCSRHRLSASEVCFMASGESMAPDDYAEKLRLSDEGVIDVAPSSLAPT